MLHRTRFEGIEVQALICSLMNAVIFCQDKKCSHNLVAMMLLEQAFGFLETMIEGTSIDLDALVVGNHVKGRTSIS